jgi:hypothetical protein
MGIVRLTMFIWSVAALSAAAQPFPREMLGEIAVRNPWVANVLLDWQRSGTPGPIGDGMAVVTSLPTTEVVQRRLAGDATAKAAPMLAGMGGRVSYHQSQVNGTLHFASHVVAADSRTLYKLFPDIVIDPAAGKWRVEEETVASGTEGAGDARAVEAVRKYSAAFVDRDVERLARLSHPSLILREGGVEGFKAMMSSIFAQFVADGSARSPEVLGSPSEEFVNGATRMIGVPMIRRVGTRGIGAMYVAFSYDGGQSWSVLGLNCTDGRWLKALAPGYRGSPDILGMANPETAKLLEGKPFDEALFLKGPKAAAR